MPASLEQKLEFRKKILPSLEVLEVSHAIPSRIPLIQAAHESNWGLSQLAVNDFNLFGMTPGSQWVAMKRGEKIEGEITPWSSLGASVCYYPTTEYSEYAPSRVRWWDIPGDIQDKREDGKGGSILTVKRYFRKYANYTESIVDWRKKITDQSRYSQAYRCAIKNDIKGFANELHLAGYATDPKYAEKLLSTAKTVDELPLL